MSAIGMHRLTLSSRMIPINFPSHDQTEAARYYSGELSTPAQ